MSGSRLCCSPGRSAPCSRAWSASATHGRWAAPILIAVGIPDLDAIRVAAIANNAPVSYGALGVPIVALAAVTGLPLLQLSSSIGHIVAILALLPPWVLIYLVSGRAGFREGWPLAIVGSLGYIAGQFPVAVYLDLDSDITGSIVCFVCLLILLKLWRPKQVLGYGGAPVSAEAVAAAQAGRVLPAAEVFRAWLPFIVLIVVVCSVDRAVVGPAARRVVQVLRRGALVARAGKKL